MSPMEFQLAFSAAVLVPAALLVWAQERGDRELPKRVRIEVFGAMRLQALLARLVAEGQRFEVRPLQPRSQTYVLIVQPEGAQCLAELLGDKARPSG